MLHRNDDIETRESLDDRSDSKRFRKHDLRETVVTLKFTLGLLRLMGKLVMECVECFSRC